MPKARRPTSERKQRITIIAAAVLLLGALLAFGREVAIRSRLPSTPTEPQLTATEVRPGEDVRTGSILFMPLIGSDCRQYLFDNTSGRLTDNGVVDCARAAYRPDLPPAKNVSAARVNVISSSFRSH